jgi:hypothetical protein
MERREENLKIEKILEKTICVLVKRLDNFEIKSSERG